MEKPQVTNTQKWQPADETGRGMLCQEVQELSLEFLGREMTLVELRLIPFFMNALQNGGKANPAHMNQDDREVLMLWRKEGHIEGGLAAGLDSLTKEFYDFCSEVLWHTYVCK